MQLISNMTSLVFQPTAYGPFFSSAQAPCAGLQTGKLRRFTAVKTPLRCASMSSPHPPRSESGPHAAFEALHPAGEPRRFAAGEVIFSAGERGDGFHLIETGRVQILARFSGAERLLATIEAGDFFGEMAVLDEAPRSATAKAETETRTRFIARAELLYLLERQPDVALTLIRQFSQRIRAINEKYVQEIIHAERLALVGRFASTIVHDFKNPLTIIGLAAELACSEDTDAELRAKSHEKIARQIERMSNMLQELIEFSRPTASRSALRETDFSEFLTPLIDDLRDELGDRRVKLTVASAPPRVRLRLDPPRLARLFYNLFNNAADAMPDGGKIVVSFERRDRELQINVRDTGGGIAAEVASTLFEPFTTHGKPDGTGLGLTICRKIVEDHEGRIWVTSEPGKGATFSFTLPLSRK
jgi:signal transduction histidine kinase